MRFSLASSVISAVVVIIVPLARAQGTLPEGTYQVESVAFNSPVLVLELFPLPSPGTPILISQSNGGQNQQWDVTMAGSTYTLTSVQFESNAFVDSVGPGAPLTGTPNDETPFLFNKLGNDTYQILASTTNEVFALQAPADAGQVTLETLDAMNPHQIWRFVAV